ncbi:FkbM family methyltransferase [Mesorhizobium sp. CO1-1-7]|uniref:FkbM family methyltransferase n=1 Tax=Mesorhizobium sp. CO1-1-7 TaxID=2876632 RepID=UPI001CD0A6F8|nr:FkbM family methyltransferase [Mesorhizobium sp. CO1-1-7]MBZ9744873.1 FkbM family methyltransferase [Mesorhizobium sp. CO1-1-7]
MAFQQYVAKDRFIGEIHFDFLIANAVGQQWYDNSPEQFMPERQWCLEKLKPGMTVVDCGAHHGIMSVIFAKAVGASGLVHAYEVLPQNAAVISQNADLNRLTNLIVHPVGLGRTRARLGYNSNLSNAIIDGRPGAMVQLVALDDDLPPSVTIDFLKLDVESFEVEALEGMPRILDQRPIIDLEIHNFLFSDRTRRLSQLAVLLSGRGYKFTLLGEIFGEFRDLGGIFDIAQIAPFDNPHVFCELR